MRLAVRADRGGRMYQDDADLADVALGLFAVADGMGASMSGRPDADLAIATLHKYYRDASQFVGWFEEARMTAAILAANAAIWAKTGALSSNEIEGIFDKYDHNFWSVAEELVTQAVARGSERHHDNVSVALVGVGG